MTRSTEKSHAHCTPYNYIYMHFIFVIGEITDKVRLSVNNKDITQINVPGL